MFGCLKHSPTLVPFHYTRIRRVHAEKLPCYLFSSLLHEHFDPHTRVPRKGDRIKSNVSCLDWVIHCMFYNGVQVWIRFKDLQWKKRESTQSSVKIYSQVSYLNEISPPPLPPWYNLFSGHVLRTHLNPSLTSLDEKTNFRSRKCC